MLITRAVVSVFPLPLPPDNDPLPPIPSPLPPPRPRPPPRPDDADDDEDDGRLFGGGLFENLALDGVFLAAAWAAAA